MRLLQWGRVAGAIRGLFRSVVAAFSVLVAILWLWFICVLDCFARVGSWEWRVDLGVAFCSSGGIS